MFAPSQALASQVIVDFQPKLPTHKHPPCTGTSGFKDGACDQAQFNQPSGVAIDEDGSVVVADYSNHRIRRINGNPTPEFFTYIKTRR